MEATMNFDGELFDNTAVLCEMRQISRATVPNWRRRGLQPEPIKIGKYKFYSRAEVERRLRRGES